jgi:hypothetical protein
MTGQGGDAAAENPMQTRPGALALSGLERVASNAGAKDPCVAIAPGTPTQPDNNAHKTRQTIQRMGVPRHQAGKTREAFELEARRGLV